MYIHHRALNIIERALGTTEETDLVNQDGSRCNIFSRSSDEYPEVPEGDLSQSKQSVQCFRAIK